MGIFLTSSRHSVVLSLLTLAAIVSVGAVSQTPPPSPDPPLAPALAQLQNPIPTAQLAFLSGYAGRTTKELMKDKQFHALLKASIPHTEYHYGATCR